MSKPFFADVGDFTTTNVGTGNETIANDTTANLGLANISAQALVASISPADIGGTTQNNYSPAGLATTGIVNLTASSAAIITGLDASVIATGRLIYLYALPTNAGNVTINHEDAGSLAANRIDLPTGTPIVLTPGSALTLRYDGGSARWRALYNTTTNVSPGPVTFSGVITPASLAAGSTNNYNPAGLATCATIRQAVNAGVQATLTGLTAQGTGGRRITIQNLGPGALLFSSEDAGSVAANRFSMPGAATFELLTDGAITFLYDGVTSRWIAENMTQCSPFVQINTTVSPAGITGTVNDYNPTGLAISGILRQALSGAAILTGIVAQTDGRILIIENIDVALILTVNSEDLGSAAANRFVLPGGTPILLNPGASLILVYDGTSARWRSIGQVGATVAPSTSAPGVFADGSDGSPVFDGSTTVLGFVPAAGRYLINRDLNCVNCTINAGAVLIFANSDTEITNAGPGNVHRLFGTGVLTNNGKISANGHGGVANSGVVNAGAGGNYANTSPAGSGGLGNVNGGSVGGALTIHVWKTQAGTSGGAITAPGVNAIGNYLGGGGGGGGAAPGGAGGGTTIAPANFGTTRDQRALLGGTTLQPQFIVFGGCGGGGAGGDASHAGGAGGGGGGLVCVIFRTITGNGVFEARGGAGNSGTVGNTGGGGGGGGGSIILYFIVGIGLCTTLVTAGVGGAGQGTGGHGGNGSDGRVFLPQ